MSTRRGAPAPACVIDLTCEPGPGRPGAPGGPGGLASVVISLDSDTSFERTPPAPPAPAAPPASRRRRTLPRKLAPPAPRPAPAPAPAPGKENVNPSRSLGSLGDCAICFEQLGRSLPASTRCGHVFCMRCLEQALAVERRCPACRRPLKSASAYHPLFI